MVPVRLLKNKGTKFYFLVEYFDLIFVTVRVMIWLASASSISENLVEEGTSVMHISRHLLICSIPRALYYSDCELVTMPFYRPFFNNAIMSIEKKDKEENELQEYVC